MTGPHQRRSHLLQIVRELKFHPDHGTCGPGPFTPHIRSWHRKYTARMTGEHSEDESVFDFLELWEELTVSIYSGIHDDAFGLADREPAPGVDAFVDPIVRKLASACYHLGDLFEGVPFGLSCRCAGGLLGIPHTKANKLLRGLCRSGWVKRTSKGKPGPAGSEASRYIFLGQTVASTQEGGYAGGNDRERDTSART